MKIKHIFGPAEERGVLINRNLSDESLQDFYRRCIECDHGKRRKIAEEYGIPATKANRAFYEAQNAIFDMFCNDLNIGKGKL